MMNRFLKLLILGLFFCGISSCSNSAQQEKQVQITIFNAMQNKLKAEFSSGNSGSKEEMTAPPVSNSGYENFSPAVYRLKLWSNDKALLEKKIGLAANEKYTAIIYGRPDFQRQVNQSNFTHKMHYVFQGSENYTKNGFLPGMILFRDQVKLHKGYCQIRVFHAAAGFSPVTVKLKSPQKTKKLISALAYPRPMQGKTISSGEKEVQLFLKGAPEALLSKSFSFEEKKVYTIVICAVDGKLDFKILEAR